MALLLPQLTALNFASEPAASPILRSLPEVLERRTCVHPQAEALLVPGRRPLTYAQLWQLVQETNSQLRGFGLDRGSRVAVVLPNGPEMATVMLAVMAGMTAAPLNPGYRQEEFEYYLKDLGANAVVVPAGRESPIRKVAEDLGIRILELAHSVHDNAGIFSFQGVGRAQYPAAPSATPDDIALLLHTSGTTARPKIVPLTHANLCASARNIAATLVLTPQDRCLSIMPLFHIHGLVAAVLTPLMSGGSVIAAPGLDLANVFSWLRDYGPTWITAVPSLYQLMVGQAKDFAVGKGPYRLRFLRTGSAPLAPALLDKLETVFGIPVIESYGLTETATQLTSNQLPPGQRKAGSAGKPAGPDVRIMGKHGEFLPPGCVGEVVVRGENVTKGYEGADSANAQAIVDGWFHTADLGYFDEEGFLFLTGRAKEMINHGGEKVSPLEVEDVLMRHPDVAQATAFAVPHNLFGEAVAAAVVLRQGASASEYDLRQFASKNLAAYKTPARILQVPELPRSSTGKLQRIGLARQLGVESLMIAPLSATGIDAEPAGYLECTLAAIWRNILGTRSVGRQDNFFELGGDSVTAAALMVEIERTFGRRLLPEVLYEAQTIGKLAEQLQLNCTEKEMPLSVVPLNRGTDGPPLFFIPAPAQPLTFRQLAVHLDPRWPAYILQSPSGRLFMSSQEETTQEANRYTARILSIQPQGPYFLCGYSRSGVLTFEMARHLMALGKSVAYVGLLDTRCPGFERRAVFHQWLRRVLDRVGTVFSPNAIQPLFERKSRNASGYGWDQFVTSVRRQTTSTIKKAIHRNSSADFPLGCDFRPPYVAKPYGGSICIYRAKKQYFVHYAQRTLGWDAVALGGVQVHDVPGDHDTLCTIPNVSVLAQFMNQDLRQIRKEIASRSVSLQSLPWHNIQDSPLCGTA
jgi:acyl-CoA synthetase (AMP-forming)/AMP-acid ligase II/thioesterase domain-containing protein/acyl carrier protein